MERRSIRGAILLMVVFFAGMAFSVHAQQVQVTPIPGSASMPAAGSPKGQLNVQDLPESVSSALSRQGTMPPARVEPEKKAAQAQPDEPPMAEETSEFEQFINRSMNAGVLENGAKEIRPGDARPGEPKGMDKGIGAIKQFGYGLFTSPRSAFTPAEEVPVGPDYVVGPGDEIRVSLWGSIDGQWSCVVDRNGTVNLPKVGVVGVTGLTFEQLKSTLRKEISKYYTGFDMNVSMGPLRSMHIYVVGNARKPGAYTVSSLSTLVSALFATGGPSKTGSMRDIRVMRNGKVSARFDLYGLLLKGVKTGDIRLLPEDVIFIPPVGPLVGISGSVNTPAIYELKGEKKLSELIAMSGGLSTVAFAGRVQMERIADGRLQKLIDADLSAVRDTDLSIQSGDLFRIFQVMQDRKVIRLQGAVNSPGEYGIKPDMRVKDLISMAGGLRYFAYQKEAELTRITVTPSGPNTEKFVIDLEQAMAGKPEHNIPLKEDDFLFVRTVPEWGLYRTVQILGEVRFPGTFTILKGERLSSLVERAGGYTDKAYLRGAVFTRVQVKELQQRGIEEMTARMQRDLLAESTTRLSTSLSPEELAAKKQELEAKQRFVQALSELKATGRMTIRLAHLRLLKGSEYDIELEAGDTLYIPTRSSVVNVMGAVMSLSSHIYEEESTYKDYIAMSGGYTRYADKSNVYVLKVDGTARRLVRGWFTWNEPRSRWEVQGLAQKEKDIEPGDTIIVPEKLDRIAWMREIKDITQILMQTAVTAGVVIELLDNND